MPRIVRVIIKSTKRRSQMEIKILIDVKTKKLKNLTSGKIEKSTIADKFISKSRQNRPIRFAWLIKKRSLYKFKEENPC